MKFTKLIFLSFLALTLQNIQAQEDPSQETGTWYILATNNKITDNFSIQAQTQLRYFELASELQQFKIRLGGTYRFSDKFSVALGYGYFNNDPSYLSQTPENFNEHRVVTDVIFFNNIKKLNIRHRYRMENRFFSNDIDPNTWLRYMLKLSHPINDSWSVDVYDEVFLNTEEPVFVQNWLGGGVSYTINQFLKARVGYQKIHFDGPDFDRILVGLTINTDFRKEQPTQNQ